MAKAKDEAPVEEVVPVAVAAEPVPEGTVPAAEPQAAAGTAEAPAPAVDAAPAVPVEPAAPVAPAAAPVVEPRVDMPIGDKGVHKTPDGMTIITH